MPESILDRIAGLAAVCVVLVGGGFAVASEAAPEPFARPTVQYQADLHIVSGRAIVSGSIHYTPDKERRVLAVRGARVPAQAMIIRRDKRVIWVLNLERKSYYGIPVSGESSPGGSFNSRPLTEKIEVGRETIDEIETTKYRVAFAENKGIRLAGHLWISDENVVLRVVGATVDKQENQSRPFHMTLKNLRFGPQPVALFGVPKGFTQVTAGHPTLGIMAPPSRSGSVRR